MWPCMVPMKGRISCQLLGLLARWCPHTASLNRGSEATACLIAWAWAWACASSGAHTHRDMRFVTWRRMSICVRPWLSGYIGELVLYFVGPGMHAHSRALLHGRGHTISRHALLGCAVFLSVLAGVSASPGAIRPRVIRPRAPEPSDPGQSRTMDDAEFVMDEFDVGALGALGALAGVGAPATPAIATPPRSRGQLAVDNHELCYICQEVLEHAADVSAQLGGNQVCHRACYNGAHALRRLADSMQRDHPEVHRTLLQMKQSDLPQWRTLCLTLRANKGNARTAEMRSSAKMMVMELMVQSKVSRKSRSLLMNERQFVAHHQVHEGLSKESAQQLWRTSLSNPAIYQENGADGVTLAVALPTELSKEESLAKRRKLSSAQELEQGVVRSVLPTLQAAPNIQGDLMFANMGLSALNASVRASSSASASSLSFEFDAPAPEVSALDVADIGRSEASGSTIGSPPATPQQQLVASNPGSGSPKVAPPTSCFEIDAPATLRTLPSFLVFKKSLKEELGKVLSTYSSPMKSKTWPEYLQWQA